MYRAIESPRPDIPGMRPDYGASSAGVFRLPLVEFEMDRSDPMVAESFMDVVQKTAEEALA